MPYPYLQTEPHLPRRKHLSCLEASPIKSVSSVFILSAWRWIVASTAYIKWFLCALSKKLQHLWWSICLHSFLLCHIWHLIVNSTSSFSPSSSSSSLLGSLPRRASYLFQFYLDSLFFQIKAFSKPSSVFESGTITSLFLNTFVRKIIRSLNQ